MSQALLRCIPTSAGHSSEVPILRHFSLDTYALLADPRLRGEARELLNLGPCGPDSVAQP